MLFKLMLVNWNISFVLHHILVISLAMQNEPKATGFYYDYILHHNHLQVFRQLVFI